MKKTIHPFWQICWRGITTLHCLSLVLLAQSLPAAATYQILNPEKTRHNAASEHFVVRWNDDLKQPPQDADIRAGLDNLESIWRFYLDTVGFPAPYAHDVTAYKVSIFLTDQSYAHGSGTGKADPAMWINPIVLTRKQTLAHEFAHTLQFVSGGLRDSRYVGWFWESHAEFMTHQMFPDYFGCSEQLLHAPHIYYGSSRDRYGNWAFWEFLKSQYGYPIINRLWTESARPEDPRRKTESVLGVLCRNEGWSTARLNDEFGRFALHNVTSDYQVHGDVLAATKKLWAARERHEPGTTLLLPVPNHPGGYTVPSYHAPQPYGYNCVPLIQSPGARTLRIWFQGLVQEKSGVAHFANGFAGEPGQVSAPHSDWRWGVVFVSDSGKPVYSPLQSGAAGGFSSDIPENTGQIWLVVAATPNEYTPLFWDQVYYSIYRYPWQVEMEGAIPQGCEAARPPTERAGAPHPHGGGWVDQTAKVDPTAYVGPEARVLGRARALDHARIEGQARVEGEAVVRDRAVIRDHACVGQKAQIAGSALVCDEAAILGGLVDQQATVGALSLIKAPKAQVTGQAVVRAIMNQMGAYDIGGTAQLLGDVELHTSINQGVFYGIVTPENVKQATAGADRRGPEPEVTLPPPPLGLDAAPVLTAPAAAPAIESPAETSGLKMGHGSRCFTFLSLSDVHFGQDQSRSNPKLTPEHFLEENRHRVEQMKALFNQPYPDAIKRRFPDLPNMPRPVGIIVAGDLIDEGNAPAPLAQKQWEQFLSLYPSTGMDSYCGKIPVFPGFGNHDGDKATPGRQGLLQYVADLDQQGRLEWVSENREHYAVNWGGFHVVMLNLYPGDAPDNDPPFLGKAFGPGSWKDPDRSLTFLKAFLSAKIGQSGAPVLLVFHIGFDAFAENDWNWWTLKERKTFYEAIRGYNIVGIIQGHDHQTQHFLWPDPKLNQADVRYFWGGHPPESFPRYDVFDSGKVCWQFTVKGDQLIALHWGLKGYEPRFTVVKPLNPVLKAPSR